LELFLLTFEPPTVQFDDDLRAHAHDFACARPDI